MPFFRSSKTHVPEKTSGLWTAPMHGIGIRSLDEEHRQLSDCVVDLRNSIKERSELSRALEILAVTCEKARTHCANEERLLDEHGYPRLEEHRQAHKKWLADIDALHQNIRTGKVSLQMAPKLLEAWFSEHIIHEDKKHAPHLRRCNAQ